MHNERQTAHTRCALVSNKDMHHNTGGGGGGGGGGRGSVESFRNHLEIVARLNRESHKNQSA